MFNGAPAWRWIMCINQNTHAVAAYISSRQLSIRDRDSIPLSVPRRVDAMVSTDWKDGKIAGLEVLDAVSLLHADFLSMAEPPITQRPS